ncbi:RNA-directed DNA polymerase from mobile element jockey-like [Brachionus plicatilis]|uniref:RNA-directed DNA polymerase from mobile element jockey-like n=1 Tax=Brachionus plicatilis TaxID=10195 RepID=A0A3M7PHE2_BRAPC|nr:RNA-directed DNA polymerase from mobile element jockey-like [Brachionus plicatilis]
MNLLSDVQTNFKNFIDNNGFINFITSPTRMATRHFGKNKVTKQSETLIDILLHNGDLVNETSVVKCPFSDHCFITAELLLAKPDNRPKTITCRNLSIKNLTKIYESIDCIEFKRMHLFNNIEDKWCFFKNELMKIIDQISPLRKITVGQSNYFPWFDDELIGLKKNRDIAYKKLSESESSFDKMIYDYLKRAYKDLNEEKIIEYFKNKSMSDFKKKRASHN